MAKNKKKPKITKEVRESKVPFTNEDGESYLKKQPSWRFAKNKNHTFDNWKILNQTQEKINEIIDSLISFEGMTWNSIMKASGGRKNGTNHHWINKDKLCSEAQEYMEKFQLDDEIFSLRLNGQNRLFGQIENGVFIIHWYDATHEICPSFKKHT